MDKLDLLDKVFANDVAKKCQEVYLKLPKSGKPVLNKEWTLLAGILLTKTGKPNHKPEPTVIALATGTKCLGKSKLSDNGSLLSDCHAEILCRRSFIKYINNEIRLVINEEASELLMASNDMKNKFALKPGVQFHLYISHTPCGDGSIFPKSSHESGSSIKRPFQDDESDSCKRLKSSDDEPKYTMDIYRTGAKCLSIEGQVVDPKLPGGQYHVVGITRTKPGRGDPTLSMSCSDKIARWNVCGIQGALLMKFLDKPIYLSSLVLGNCPFDKIALKRALIDRSTSLPNELPPGYIIAIPELLKSDFTFESSKQKLQNDKAGPSCSAIIWCNLKNKPLEVCVDGRKQGVTLKNLLKPTSRLSVSKASLFNEHIELCKLAKINNGNMETYAEYKESSTDYHKVTKLFKQLFQWIEKPIHLNQFKND